MDFGSVLQTSSKKTMKALLFRKSSIFLSITLILILFLSSLGNADIGNTNASSTINQATDTDGDGLSDDLEDELDTDKDNKFGDNDNDGLYDFEEYLDIYGTPDNTGDSPKYNYNNSTSYNGDNGPILDIYHYFNLSSNKTNYLRDQNFTRASGGFTDYLLWNVTFTGDHSGGAAVDAVSYSHNIMIDASFTGRYSGGSFTGAVSYNHNIMIDVSFTGDHSGGSYHDSISYSNNTMTSVIFAEFRSGGSLNGNVSYSNNTMRDISFPGMHSGGSLNGNVSYSNNTMRDISFPGENSGGSLNGNVSYSNNTMRDISFPGENSGGSKKGSVSYTDNVIVSDNYDTDSDGLGDGYELFESGTDPRSSDTDGDGFVDKWEVTYNGTPGVDPLVEAMASDFASDIDNDGLVLSEEAKANTDPTSNDTDGDGLNDEWEVRYHGTPGVNPLVAATNSELDSDADNDGSTLLEEAIADTNPSKGPKTVDDPTSMNTAETFTVNVNSFTLLIVLGSFTFFSLALVVYRVRRRVL